MPNIEDACIYMLLLNAPCTSGVRGVQALGAVADAPRLVREATLGDVSPASMSAYSEESSAAVLDNHSHQGQSRGAVSEAAAARHGLPSGMKQMLACHM